MRRRSWKIALGILAGMGLVVGAIVGDTHRRASATFEHHERELAARVARIQGRDGSRPPLGGEPIDGNAWESYSAAFKALELMPADEQVAIPEGDEEPDDDRLRDIFLKYAPQVALLERGVRCRRVEPGFDYSAGADMDLSRLTGAIFAAKFLQSLIAYHHRLGNDAEALRLVVIGLAMAQDVGRKGPVLSSMIQFVCEFRILEGVRELVSSGHQFAQEDLERFTTRLDDLEQQRPRVIDAWEAEDIFVRGSLIRADWNRLRVSLIRNENIRPTWRSLFSSRIMRAQALNVDADLLSRASDFGALSPKERKSEAEKLSVKAEAHPNELVRGFMPPPLKVFERDAVAILGRMMLRVATAIARFQLEHGRNPERFEDLVPRYMKSIPGCPLTGQPLRYKDGKVWSVGINEVDNDGAEAVYGSPDDGGDGDVVWTVKRK